MVDRPDSVITSEKLGLYGIIIGLIGIATAYIAFGIAQLKIFEAYLPYIFISIGAVYLVLSAVLLKSLRSTPRFYRPYPTGTHPVDRLASLRHNVRAVFANALVKIITLGQSKKFRFGLFLIVAFIAGSFVTYTLSNSSGLQNFHLPQLNLTLPQINLPKPNQSTASSAVVKLEPKTPVKIVDFSVSKVGDGYNVSFSLADKDSVKVVTGGNVSLKIMGQSNSSLYEENLNPQESDFKSSVYSWIVDSSKVKKSTSDSGTAALRFISSLGVDMSTNANVQVPVMSDSDLQKTYDDQYKSSSTTVGKTVKKYLFEVTLNKIGFYNVIESGTKKTYYRADVSIKNSGSVEETFKTSTARLTIGGSSFTPAANSPLKNGVIKGGQTLDGYILFDGVPQTATGSTSVRVGTATAISELEYIIDV